MSDCQVMILTRWNIGADIRTRPGMRGVRDMAEWSARRREIMLRMTAPSLFAQTDADFTWIILADPQSDPEYSPYQGGPRIAVEPCRGLGPGNTDDFGDVAAAIARHRTADRVLTCRLDSDDAVHRQYVGRMRWLARLAEPGHVVLFTRGYEIDLATGRTCEYPPDVAERRPLAFYGLLEAGERIAGAFATGRHTTVLDRFPSVVEPWHGWLRGLHGGNVSRAGLHRRRPARIDLAQYGLESAHA